jgi:plastocyanin
MSTYRSRRLFAGAAPMMLVFALAGCGSDQAATTTTAATETIAQTSTDASTDSATTESAASTESAGSTESVGGASVGGVVLSDGEAPAERTIVISADAMTPNALTVKVGDTVTFRAADGIHAVIVGDLDGATVSKGLIETFTFSATGSYPVRDDVGAGTATITVE